jgi:Peptidase A4 family
LVESRPLTSSRPWSYTQPELVTDPTIDALRAEQRARGEFTSGNWGGAVVTTAQNKPPNLAFAQFTVPTVLSIDPSLTEQMIVGFWVGIGGYGNGTLLQAGIGATVTPNRELLGLSSVSYWGWTEWTPAGFVVNNFDVQAGDTVSVLVCAPQANHGFVMLGNSRTNQAVSVGLNPEAGETANGPSAEWIVEAITPLTPAFTPLTFFGCVAGDHDSSCGVTGATLIDMPDPLGTNEVKTTIASPSSVLIQWEAFQ